MDKWPSGDPTPPEPLESAVFADLVGEADGSVTRVYVPASPKWSGGVSLLYAAGARRELDE